MILLNQLKSLITAKQTSNDNKSGTSITQLMTELNLTTEEINPLLKQLYDEKFIRVRQGVNSKLLFLK